MAKLTGPIQFIGTIGDLTAYTRADSKTPILRRKAGPTGKRVKTDDNYRGVRKWNKEWGGCTKAVGAIRKSMYAVKHVGDANFGGHLTSLCGMILKQDKVSPLGCRCIYFSCYKSYLEGFNLNLENTFDTVIKVPVPFSINRQEGTATITFPRLLPKINFTPKWDYPMFRFITMLGVIEDVILQSDGLVLNNFNKHPPTAGFTTEWQPAAYTYEGETITLALPSHVVISESLSLNLSIGIEFGKHLSNTIIVPIKKAGCAKILAIG